MNPDSFAYTGLDLIEAAIRKLGARASYLNLQDRTVRGADQSVGRFDFDATSAAPFLEPPANDAAGSDDAPADPFDDDLPDVGPDGAERPDLAPAAIAEAACRWVRQTAMQNTIGEVSRRFRIRVFGPKGEDLLFSGTFLCRNDEAEDDLTFLPTPPMPIPTWDQAATESAVKPLKALGDGYAQFMTLVMSTVGQFQGLNNSMHARQHRQLREAQDQVEQLVASILEFRAAQVEAHENRKADEHQADSRTELARHALKQLGDAAQALVLAKGLPPDVGDLMGVLGSSPDLMSTLRDPSVRALMKDPKNLQGLAQMLRLAADQAKAANTPNPDAAQAAS